MAKRLLYNERILNEPQHASNVCFNNTTADIGDDTEFTNVCGIEDVDFKEYLSKNKMFSEYESHPSVANIRNHHSILGNQGFSFNHVELNEVEKKTTDAEGT